jgi:hypothetical protein
LGRPGCNNKEKIAMRFVIIIFVLFFADCSDQKPEHKLVTAKKDTIEHEGTYPKQINTKDLQMKYDKVRWAMYCIYCDDTCRFLKETGIKDSVTFASLDFRLEKLQQFNDTTEVYFYFYKDSIKCDFRVIKNIELAIGAGYKKGDDNISYYISPTTMRYFWEKGTYSRYENPLQPEVITYINNNKSKLNRWFFNEAKRKGIIK